MEPIKIGVRQFRDRLAGYPESGTPLAIMRHGETLGYFIPAHKRSRKAELESMRAAAKDLDEILASWGVGEEQLMAEFEPDDIFRIVGELNHIGIAIAIDIHHQIGTVFAWLRKEVCASPARLD